MFFQTAVPFEFAPVMNESSCGSTSSPAFGFVSVPDFGHSNRCVVNFQFPEEIRYNTSFYDYFSPVYLLWSVYSGSWPIFWKGWLFSYCWILRVVCIIWVIVLYQMYLLQIFSLSLWCVFSFSWHCLLQTDVFNFNVVQLSNYLLHGSWFWCCI